MVRNVVVIKTNVWQTKEYSEIHEHFSEIQMVELKLPFGVKHLFCLKQMQIGVFTGDFMIMLGTQSLKLSYDFQSEI